MKKSLAVLPLADGHGTKSYEENTATDMKKTVTLQALLGLAALAAPAQNYTMGNPNDEANYGYLKAYAPLKDYIDTQKYPNFKLGIGTTVPDYLNNQTVRGMTNDNFTETVAGNAMKMASCVSSNGSMNFATVKSYVDAATRAGLNVYGHTLAWHSQQPTAWLNSLIRDKAATPFEHPDTTVLQVLKTKDFRTQQNVGWTADKATYGFSIDYSATDGLHLKTTKKNQSWEVQFVAVDGLPLEVGKDYVVTITARASKQGRLYTKLGDWSVGVNVNATFGTEWQDLQLSYKGCKGGSFLLLQCGDFVGDLYIRSIKLSQPVGAMKVSDGDGKFHLELPQSVPLTAQEKHDTLVWAMERWISGMMNACGGRVKAWDVVNEAIAGGGNDGSGNYTLQHDNGSGDFFWQDHMGDLEYVRSAVRQARKYGPADVKLFVNDYNLESDWDGNKKLRSLINWIKKWEADGVTHIDGIGTQMHISCYMNAQTQASKKNAITTMFRLMAQSGKLVRVSELDMGMVDQNGKDVPTGQMTEQMHHQMADLYQWIVEQYLTIIPPAQQWGICFWCPTDSPVGSGWRANTPVGIWTLNFYRKHAYAGIAKGLGGVVATGVTETPRAAAAPCAKPVYRLDGTRLPAGTQPSQLPPGIYIVGGKKLVRR